MCNLWFTLLLIESANNGLGRLLCLHGQFAEARVRAAGQQSPGRIWNGPNEPARLERRLSPAP